MVSYNGVRMSVIRVRRIIGVFLLVVLSHLLTLSYGYFRESRAVAPIGMPGVIGLTHTGWKQLGSGSAIAWHHGAGITCETLVTVRSPKAYIDPMIKSIYSQSEPVKWSVAVDLMEKPTTQYDVVSEIAFGFHWENVSEQRKEVKR